MPLASEIIFNNSQAVVTALRKHPLIDQYFNSNDVESGPHGYSVSAYFLAFYHYEYEKGGDQEPEFATSFYKDYPVQKILSPKALRLCPIRDQELYFPFLQWLCYVARTTRSRIYFTYEFERGDAIYEDVEWTFDYSENATVTEAIYVRHPDGEYSTGKINLMKNGDVFVDEYSRQWDCDRNGFVEKKRHKSWSIFGGQAIEADGTWLRRESSVNLLSDFVKKEDEEKLRH